ECVALGFLEVTEQGRSGNGEFRAPNLFRLTYRHMKSEPATDDWRRIETIAEAQALARAARASEKQKTSAGNPHRTSAGNPHRRAKSPVRETPTTRPVGETPTTSISRGDSPQ